MSLNDYARLSNNDLELYKQLSDSSYRSINGKRQSSRNFKEGVLNLGQIHFEQPKNVLTKEMILEYQKEQQGKPAYTDITSGDQFNYVPSNINEQLNVFNPTNLPSGAPATENDVGNKLFEIQNALKDLKYLDNEEITKKEKKVNLEIYKIQLEEKEKETNDTLNAMTSDEADINSKLKPLYVDRLDVKKKLDLAVKKNYSTIETHQQKYNQLDKDIKEAEETLQYLKSSIPKLKKKLTKIQADIPKVDNEIITIDTRLNDIQTLRLQIQQAIPNLETELKQLSENYEQNKIDAAEIKRQNKLITKKYEDTFNLANLNRINIQQDRNETEEDFIQRLQTLEGEKFDVNIYKDKAQGEQNKRLSENLKNVIRNDYIIWDVIKALTSEQIFETNKFFNIISTRLLKLFGYDNKNISPKDLRDEIIKTLDIIKTEPENVYELEEDPNKSGLTVGETAIPHADGTSSDFKYKVDDNSLYIENITTNKGVYIKIGTKDKENLLFSSDTNLKGSFNRINFKEKGGFKKILKELELNQDKNKDILITLFGNDLNKDAIYDRLSNDLKPVDESIITKKRENYYKVTYGFGLNKIPETTQFGKNIILLKKLYYNNILSIKDRNLHNIEGLKNVLVSDNFVKIIMDIVTKQKPSLHNINISKSDEKELYNTLLLISGVHY